MLRSTARTLAVVLGGLPALFAASVFCSAWGEWRCGINRVPTTLADLIGAARLSASIIYWRQTVPADQQFSGKWVILPWVIFGALTIFVFALAPECPFPSR